MVMLRKILLLSSLFITATHAADKNLYLFDVLKDPKYLSSWNGLFKDEVGVDDWLDNYAKSGDGPSGYGENVFIAGREYLIRNVCKTHDCGSNYFVVALPVDGTDALGVLKRIRYVRDFDFNQNKFVSKMIRENIFFGPNKDSKDESINSLKSVLRQYR